MRVFLGCSDIASFLPRLASALGHSDETSSCYLFTTSIHPYCVNPNRSDDPSYSIVCKPLVSLLLSIQSRPLLRYLAAPVIALCWLLLRLLITFWAMIKIDAFLFVSGKSLLPFGLDARLFRVMGKRVVHIYLGTSSRPRFMGVRRDKSFETKDAKHWLGKLKRRISRQARRLRHHGKCADIVIDNPLCGQYHDRPFVSWFHVGFSSESRSDNTYKQNRPLSASVRIVHSPSVPAIKGSVEISEAIGTLKKEGYKIDFIQLTGVPRARVLEEIDRCDLVIDQLYSDTPLASFACEAAERSRMAVVGGYGWKELEQWMPPGLPVQGLCHPTELKDKLRSLLDDRESISIIGRQAHEFITGYWSSREVARRMLAIFRGDIPEDWYCHPSTIQYFLGQGADKEHRLKIIRSLVDEYGMSVLGPVSDNLKSAISAELGH